MPSTIHVLFWNYQILEIWCRNPYSLIFINELSFLRNPGRSYRSCLRASIVPVMKCDHSLHIAISYILDFDLEILFSNLQVPFIFLPCLRSNISHSSNTSSYPGTLLLSRYTNLNRSPYRLTMHTSCLYMAAWHVLILSPPLRQMCY